MLPYPRQVCTKILNTRLWPEQQKTWQNSVMKMDYEVLLVPQPSLSGTLDSNNEPIIEEPMDQSEHDLLFDKLVSLCEQKYSKSKVRRGVVGEGVSVLLLNDGPVTLELDSPVSAGGGKKDGRAGAVVKGTTTKQKTPAKQAKKKLQLKQTRQVSTASRTGPEPRFPMGFYKQCMDNFNDVSAEAEAAAAAAYTSATGGGATNLAPAPGGADEIENSLALFAYYQNPNGV
jgi:D-Tyr-tRNAtyr deacylase